MNYKIIIADDEPIILSGIINSCNWNDYNVDIIAQATNIKQVLNLVEELSPDIIVTDIFTPVTDGIELIKQLHQKYPHIKVLVLSSISDFNYVRECFKYGVKDYLLKSEVTPKILVEKICSLCTDNNTSYTSSQFKTNYNKILSDYIETSSEKYLENLSEYFNNKKFNLIGFSINDITNSNNTDISQVVKAIKSYITKYFPQSKYGYVTNMGYCMILLNFDCDNFHSKINSFFNDVQNIYPIFKLFLSNEFYNLVNLTENYNYIKNILSKRIYFGKNVIEYQKLSICEEQFEFSNIKFSKYIKTKNIDKAINMLNEYFSLVKKYKFIDDYSIKRFSQNIIYNIVDVLESMNIKTNLSNEKIDLFRKIDIAISIDELINILVYAINISKDSISYNDSFNLSNLSDKAKMYIDENYMYEINLKELANILHVNYSYLSTNFKSKTGQSIISYINDKRISKAKKLLENTNKFVFEISMETGFSDHNYFSKVFKKSTGLTPHEYRLNLK